MRSCICSTRTVCSVAERTQQVYIRRDLPDTTCTLKAPSALALLCVVLVVHFRGTTGPLAGGVAHHASTHWQPNSHKSSQGPLAAFPFPLPPEYDAALQQQYGVVTELRSKIKGSGLDEGRRVSLQVGRAEQGVALLFALADVCISRQTWWGWVRGTQRLPGAAAELSVDGYVVTHAAVCCAVLCCLAAVCLCAQNVIQSYFREWLHSTGNIRQVGRKHTGLGCTQAGSTGQPSLLLTVVHVACRGAYHICRNPNS
jgi:hypothetical protein